VGYFIGSPGMNLLDARGEGDRAVVGGHSLALGGSYGRPEGRVQIGIRPEFVTPVSGEGLPVVLRRVEDVGRHRILRAEFEGREINAILPEGTPMPADGIRLAFEPSRTLVYANDWRVRPEGTRMGRAA
jgi:glycerol transport system ATP-binding protein